MTQEHDTWIHCWLNAVPTLYTVLLFKAKRQYLLTCEVSRYYLSGLHDKKSNLYNKTLGRLFVVVRSIGQYTCQTITMSENDCLTGSWLHIALCSLLQPDTDGTRVSKCRQLSQETRGLDPMLFQCWSNAVGGGPILKQYWVKNLVFAGLHTVVCLHPPLPSIIFTPADQGTFSKTAGQSQAY